MSEQAVVETLPQAEQATSLLAVISRAATDPQVDIDKMERLMQMHERIVAQQAQQAFQAALAEMQPDLPTIQHRGDANGRYTFALWEDIHAAIVPVMSRHGFSMYFSVDTADAVRVTATLAHSAGHRESTQITLPADGSGNKNAVQAVASSVAYGKRYTAGALLNFATTGEDDDAQSVEDPPLTDDQAAEIMDRLEAVGADLNAFRAWLGVESVADIRASQWPRVIRAVEQKEAAARG